MARRLLNLSTVTRWLLLALLLLATSSCLLPAEIEEEEPEEDLPPFFDALAVEPSLGEVTINLDAGFQTFGISRVYDPNTSQDLYFRVLVEYDVLGIATFPDPVPASQRDTLNIFSHTYGPCVPQHEPFATAQAESKDTTTLYLAVSDAPFVNPEQSYEETPEFTRLEQAFATDPPGRAIIAQWFILFEGSCPLIE